MFPSLSRTCFTAAPGDWETYLEEVVSGGNLPLDKVAALSTGVSMEHLAWKEQVFDELWVAAFVTAGVKSITP
jgi:adenosylcobinamide amidohydrolase